MLSPAASSRRSGQRLVVGCSAHVVLRLGFAKWWHTVVTVPGGRQRWGAPHGQRDGGQPAFQGRGGAFLGRFENRRLSRRRVHTARSGRYPKMSDLPSWQAILARRAFGLGPEGEDGFYHHRTRLVFPRCEPLAAALARRCPGVGAAHRHVPLKGSRLGSSVTRCTEAGVYSEDFVAEVVRTLTTALTTTGC